MYTLNQITRKIDSLYRRICCLFDRVETLEEGGTGGGTGGVTEEQLNTAIESNKTRFGIEDNVGLQTRSLDMQSNSFDITNVDYFDISTPSYKGNMGVYDKLAYLIASHEGNSNGVAIGADARLGEDQSFGYIRSRTDIHQTYLKIRPTRATIARGAENLENDIVTSVNGVLADSTGNIALENNYNIKTVNSDYTALDEDDYVLVDSTNGNINITLPNAIGRLIDGRTKPITIKKIVDANIVNILTQNGQTIDGAAPEGILDQSSVPYISDNSNFYIV